jgi:hypothetical protein
MTASGGVVSEQPCPGHYPACYHGTDFIACDACIERRKGGPLFCPDLDNCAGPGCFDHLAAPLTGGSTPETIKPASQNASSETSK